MVAVCALLVVASEHLFFAHFQDPRKKAAYDRHGWSADLESDWDDEKAKGKLSAEEVNEFRKVYQGKSCRFRVFGIACCGGHYALQVHTSSRVFLSLHVS